MSTGMSVQRTDVNMTGVIILVSNGIALVDFGSEDATYFVPVNRLVKTA